jgi:hypothetical protein
MTDSFKSQCPSTFTTVHTNYNEEYFSEFLPGGMHFTAFLYSITSSRHFCTIVSVRVTSISKHFPREILKSQRPVIFSK